MLLLVLGGKTSETSEKASFRGDGSIDVLDRYIKQELVAYRRYRDASKANSDRIKQRHRTWLKRTRLLTEWLAQEGVPVPEEYLQPYASLPEDRMAAGLPIKYQIRAYNILRDLARVQASCPELLSRDATPREVLDQSSGGCGLWECLTPLGHDVTCVDYFCDEQPREFGHAYSHIHGLLGLDVAHVDGTSRPFPFAAQSQDYVFCFQAIDAYAPGDRWSEPVLELLRIARIAAVVVLNPPARSYSFEDSVARLLADMEAEGVGAHAFRCPDTSLPGYRFDKKP